LLKRFAPIHIMKLTKVVVVSTIFIIALLAFLLAIYFVYLENLFNIYSNIQNSVMEYFLSPQLIKPNNKSITVNSTTFELMYYNVSKNELTELIHNTITLINDIEYLLAPIVGLIILYVLYIFLYFRVFIRNKNLLPSFVFHSLCPTVIEGILIIFIPSSLGYIFLSWFFPFLLSLLYTLDHLLPLDSAYSMIDSLIFTLDIFLFVVEFLIERVTENKIASVPTTIDKAMKLFHSFNVVLEHVIKVLKLLIKILVVITFVISIGITFLAYYNIAYLTEDFQFVANTMSIITVLVLFVLITEFLVNISFEGMS